MQSDRELLELAARAAGLVVAGLADKMLVDPERRAGGLIVVTPTGGHTAWNPLTDDGDALRLAVKLGLTLHAFPDHHQGAQSVVTMTRHAIEAREYAENNADDLNAAARRAIVRAAAAIGQEQGGKGC